MNKAILSYPHFEKELLNLWNVSSPSYPKNLPRFSYWQKLIWEHKCFSFIKKNQRIVSEQKELKSLVLKKGKHFLHKYLRYKSSGINFILSKEMLTASHDFLQQAWQFDPELSKEEIMQAFRNIWIILGLQVLFQRKVEVSPSLLAYSLLYPYTDNLIDDPKISSHEKAEFAKRFAKRLAGKKIAYLSAREAKIYSLVEMIEKQYKRDDYPDLYLSLLDIHFHQTNSVQLQNNNFLSSEDRLRICIAKGASSVIADGYLIQGKLSPKEQELLYFYGAYLQIIDDIQDAREDLQEGNLTYFAKHLQNNKLDDLSCKSLHFSNLLIQKVKTLYPKELAFLHLLQHSFQLLFVGICSQNPNLYSSNFLKKIEENSPCRSSFFYQIKELVKPYEAKMNEKLDQYRENCFQKVV